MKSRIRFCLPSLLCLNHLLLLLISVVLAPIALLTQARQALSQDMDRWDTRFGKLGVHGMVRDIAEDSRGNIYIVGQFTLVNDGAANLSVRNIVIWDGESFRSPGGGVNSYVNTVSIDSDDNVYIGGSFGSAFQSDGSTLPARGIAMWDGSSWSALGVQGSPNNGVDRWVNATHIIDDILYVGGNFTEVRQPDGTATPAANIAAWDGSQWIALGSGTDGHVNAFASRNGTLYAGGQFEHAGDTAAHGIASWDGAEWSALAVNPSRGMLINDLVIGPDDNLYVGGHFALVQGRFVYHIAMWDGENWNALNRGIESGMGTVYALDADDTYVYAGGTLFEEIGEHTVNHVARWDGDEWYAMDGGVHGGLVMDKGNVYAIRAARGSVYVGGYFGLAGNVSAENIARWDGTKWNPLGFGGNLGLNNSVYALGMASHGVYAGGIFTSAGSEPFARLVRWDGAGWHDDAGRPNGAVNAIIIHDNNVYVGGNFWMIDNFEVSHVGMWDGRDWHHLGRGIDDPVSAIAVDDAGNVYVGGNFSYAINTDGAYVQASNIAKWDGEQWHALGDGTNGQVRAIAVTGNNVYAGGMFLSASGKPVNFVAKWDGSEWHDMEGGVDSWVNALAVDDSGNLYAGGSFTKAGGRDILRVARWDGSQWHALGGGITGVMVNALAIDGNVLYAGGFFEGAGYAVAAQLAKWQNGRWENLHEGLWSPFADKGQVFAVAAKDERVFAGGSFLQAGKRPSFHFASWTESGTGHYDLLTFTQAPERGMAVATNSEIMLKWDHASFIREVKLEIRYGLVDVPWEELTVLPAGTKQYPLAFGTREHADVLLRITDTGTPINRHTVGPFSIRTPEYISTRFRIHHDYGAWKLFHRKVDGWSFLNQRSNLWPYEEAFPDWDTFCAALSDRFCYTYNGWPRITAKNIWRIMRKWGWKGSCSGFSAASLLFFNDHMFVPIEFHDYNYIYDVPVNPRARNMLNALQIRFLLPVAADFLKHYTDKWAGTPIEALEELEASMDKYKGHLSLVLMDPDSKKSVHTIQPYRIVREDNKATIYCYDSNHPHEPTFHETTELTVDLVNDTWSYTYSPYKVRNATEGLFTSPELSYFLRRPDIMRKTPFSPEESLIAYVDQHGSHGDRDQPPITSTKSYGSHSNRELPPLTSTNPYGYPGDLDESFIFIYPDPGSALVIENESGQQIGRLAGEDLIHSLPGSVPILPPVSDSDPELPLGYFVPADSYRISKYHQGESQTTIFAGSTIYTYRNLSSGGVHADQLHLSDGLSVVNHGKPQMDIALYGLTMDDAGEKQFRVRNLGLSNGDSLHIAIDGQQGLQLLNSGSARLYELEVNYVPEYHKAGTVIYREIPISGNSRHRLVPPWDDLEAEPMRILIDSNLDGVYDDSTMVDGEYATEAFRGLEETGDVPSGYALFQNYPNPFNAQTTIRFHVPETVDARLDLYNILGQHVARIHHGTVTAGSHEVLFDASLLASGVYIYRLQTGSFNQSRKLLFMK